MNKKIKTTWLKAMRSEQYQQTRLMLVNDDDEFCCLGVLCNISDMGEWKKIDGLWTYGKSLGNSAYLPRSMREAIGISIQEESQLTEMNDSDKKSFAEIADWVEENL